MPRYTTRVRTETLGNKTLDSTNTLSNPLVTKLLDTASVNRFIPAATAKTIVDGSATALFTVAIAAAASIGGTIHYHVYASNGTDHQGLSGIVTYAAVNKAGTLTMTITEVAGNQAKAVSSGTLTLAWTMTDDTNVTTIKLQPTGSLTETTFNVTFTVYPLKGAVTLS